MDTTATAVTTIATLCRCGRPSSASAVINGERLCLPCCDLAVKQGIAALDQVPQQPRIVRNPVLASSMIAEMGYDAPTGTVEVLFHGSGGIYRYKGVPAALYNALRAAPSVGRAFHASIRHRRAGERCA